MQGHDGCDMSADSATPSRRTFVKGLAATGAAASLGLLRGTAWAQSSPPAPAVLSGTAFDLTIAPLPVNITGASRTALAINGSLPGPLLRWREGDTVTVRVANQARNEEASIHWHGILLPANMDGVPGLSFNGIRPGESYTYRIRVRQHGTYWYHSHSAFQEQLGVYGPLVIEPREPEPFAYDREHVVLLSDWTDADPMRVFANLKKQSDYYNFRQRTVGDFIGDVRRNGLRATLAERRAWGAMRMSNRDLADVTGSAYTYLMNGHAPGMNWTGLFRHGERVRLRFINGSSMTYFDVRIPGVRLTVVAADGQPVKPVTVDEFRIAVAETLDAIVEPAGQDALTIFAQAMDRTGYAAGTLAVRDGLRASVPDLDPRPGLTLADMGHGGMDHTAHPGTPTAPASDPHAGHTMPAQPAAPVRVSPAPRPHIPLPNAAIHSWTCRRWRRAARLDDPGIGLRDNGRRVLTYADLASIFDDPDGREPSRTIELHLTGHMGRFAWSFDGVKFADAEPLRLTYGERLRIVLVNDTMMTHPIHLHGMWSDLEDDEGRFRCASTPSTCLPAPDGAIASLRTRWAAGPITVISCITWKRECSARSASRKERVRDRARHCPARLPHRAAAITIDGSDAAGYRSGSGGGLS